MGEFLTPAGAVIYAPPDGPAFQIGPHISRVHLHVRTHRPLRIDASFCDDGLR